MTTTPVPAPARVVVAVDGHSGSGKSSVSRGVARALRLRYLDTGAMYRAVTWAVLRGDVPLDDPAAVARTAEAAELDWSSDSDESRISVDGTDVSAAVREQAVTAAVSAVAAVPEVRALLVRAQRGAVERALAAGQGIVVEGRDIGSVVLPDADLKVWLVADPRVRAERRAAEDVAAGRLTETEARAAVEAVAADLARRDAADSGRSASPTARADDAVVVDATQLTLDEVVAEVVALVRDRAPS